MKRLIAGGAVAVARSRRWAGRGPARFVGVVAGLDPACFAFVMATGILSVDTDALGLVPASLALLGIAAGAYAALCVLTAWRVVVFWGRLTADVDSPGRSFGLFAFVAASGVLGLRLLAAGARPEGELLSLAGAAAWLALVGTVPGRLLTRSASRPLLDRIGGGWLLWVVATQSVATSAGVLASHDHGWPAALSFATAVLWSCGVAAYLVLSAAITLQLVQGRISARRLSPSYWILMGATAISVFTAGQLLSLPREPVASGIVAGLAIVLWAAGTLWIPPLVWLGVWRHVLMRVPLDYETGLWSMVFPLGMYVAATRTLGIVTGIPALGAAAGIEIWVALAAWTFTFLAMLRAGAAWLRPPAGHEPV